MLQLRDRVLSCLAAYGKELVILGRVFAMSMRSPRMAALMIVACGAGTLCLLYDLHSV